MTEPQIWTRFACDGHSFEYAVVLSQMKTRPAGWPMHKASPGLAKSVVTVCVRRVGDETGPAMIYPEGTVVGDEQAREAARCFWAQLTK